jgi:hypothetical protein
MNHVWIVWKSNGLDPSDQDYEDALDEVFSSNTAAQQYCDYMNGGDEIYSVEQRELKTRLRVTATAE